MEIITGRTGTPHVYAADDAEIYRLFLGDGDFLLTTGNKLIASMYGTTKVRIADGSLIMQGRLAKIRPSDGYDELDIDIGTVGYKRVDLVVAEYNQRVVTEQVEIEGEIVDVVDKFDSVELKIVKGTPNANSYVEPAITTGNIDDGETHQVKLWAIQLDGINFNALIDYRVILDTTPIQTALDYAKDSTARIDSLLASDLAKIESEIDRILGVSKVAPLVTVVAHNVSSTSGVLNVPSVTYQYTSGDVFTLYLNGLKVPVDKYDVSSGTNGLRVELDYTTSSDYDDVEIEVWRPAQD